MEGNCLRHLGISLSGDSWRYEARFFESKRLSYVAAQILLVARNDFFDFKGKTRTMALVFAILGNIGLVFLLVVPDKLIIYLDRKMKA